MNNNLVFLTEIRIYSDEFNNIYFDKDLDVNIWNNYLFYYKHITVFARTQRLSSTMLTNYVRNDNNKISFVSLPYYVGLKGLLIKRRKLIKKIEDNLKNYISDPIVLRVPGIIGFYGANFLKKQGASYGIEVVGDPYEVFSKENFNHPLRLILQKISIKQLKETIAYAKSVVYVTKKDLQRKYPASLNAKQFSISNVRINDSIIANNPRKYKAKSHYNIVCIGSLAQMYKGADVMLEAVKYINEKNCGFSINLTWLGDGIYKSEMQTLAKKLNIDDKVQFLGSVNSETVFNEIDLSDLFVHPSRTEGLPRVVIEAMCKGIPVVATNVGGIPELLEEKAMVNKNDSKELAIKIIEVLSSPALYNQQADRNLKFSRFFKQSNLNEKRRLFFNSLK
ncbi:glycosyltransferase [Psychrobacter sp. AOP29-E1-7]|uniref:glycosyltransferase n=1 Tax=Psychrobacter sp. AOP29-E1-7 TaxID=3457702 RepID=UPI004036B449